jgi:glutathione S-transferase
LILYDNPFSPFARKVRMALDFKGIAYSSVDALALRELARLRAIAPRAEAPVLVDGETVIAESADIVCYLEDIRPEPAIMPLSPNLRAKARYWRRMADRTLDSIIHDISLWFWPTHRRADHPPDGLYAAGLRDLEKAASLLEEALPVSGYVCGAISIADFALFPHMTSMQRLGVKADPQNRPRTHAWMQIMRAQDAVRKDLAHVRRAAADRFADWPSPYEAHKVVWRGDRIEWLLAQGFDEWWMKERREGRAVVPQSLA